MRTPPLYRLTRWIIRIALTVYFRKLEVTGLENVPDDGPVILAANHPQSVTDALVLGAGCRRMVCYLAHSGLFRKRLQAWFLRQVGVIPVYRAQDSADAGDQNVQMFAACHDVMRRQGVIGIFPEGASAEEPRVQRLKTGTARIALQSEDEAGWSLGVKIVPVGLNFESSQRFRSRVLLRFGPPIEALDYRARFATDPVETVNALTVELRDAIRDIVIDIEHSEFEELVRDLEMLYKDELLAREGLDVPGDSRFKQNQWLSRELPRALSYFLEHRPELIWRVRQMLREYRGRLERLRIKDDLLRQERGTSIPGAATRFVIWGALGLPFAAYGALWNVLPYRLTGWLAERAPDTTKIHYYRLRNGAPIYLVYYGVLVYFAYRALGGVGGTVFALTLPLTGFFARSYTRRMTLRRDRIRLGFLELHHGFYLQTLRQQRRRLIREVDAAAGHYAGVMRLSEWAAPSDEDSRDPSPDSAGGT
jgi:1-acyl-sn-glycerol-3-phosphate acyltransferase